MRTEIGLELELVREDGNYKKYPCTCGGEIRRVTKSFTNEDGVTIRERKCLSCGTRIRTKEDIIWSKNGTI